MSDMIMISRDGKESQDVEYYLWISQKSIILNCQIKRLSKKPIVWYDRNPVGSYKENPKAKRMTCKIKGTTSYD
jgi:hypothetical protein